MRTDIGPFDQMDPDDMGEAAASHGAYEYDSCDQFFQAFKAGVLFGMRYGLEGDSDALLWDQYVDWLHQA